jgi:hypothetical protein
MGHPKHTFLELQRIFPSLTAAQVKSLTEWYRHLLAQQAVIMPGTQFTDEATGDVIEFGPKGEPTHIRVVPFCRAVRAAWVAFDRSRINPKLGGTQPPRMSIAVSTSTGMTTSSLPGASGYYVTSTLKKP